LTTVAHVDPFFVLCRVKSVAAALYALAVWREKVGAVFAFKAGVGTAPTFFGGHIQASQTRLAAVLALVIPIRIEILLVALRNTFVNVTVVEVELGRVAVIATLWRVWVP
jgi:hypothetical protein